MTPGWQLFRFMSPESGGVVSAFGLRPCLASRKHSRKPWLVVAGMGDDLLQQVPAPAGGLVLDVAVEPPIEDCSPLEVSCGCAGVEWF